jgi:hypothetical protein
MRNGRRAGGATVIAALAGLCLLAGCSGPHSAADFGTHSTSTTSVTASTSSGRTTSSSTTTETTTSAVLAAYRAGWAAFEHALADANPEDPELPAIMVDPQLQQVKGNLLADQQQGMVGRGTTTLHPKVTALSATSATVVDCAYSTAELVYKATGKPVPPITPPENDGVTSTLVLSGGTWKVSKQIVTDGKCTPGA